MIKLNKSLGSFFRYISLKMVRLCTHRKCSILPHLIEDQGLSLSTIRNCASRQEGCLDDTDYL